MLHLLTRRAIHDHNGLAVLQGQAFPHCCSRSERHRGWLSYSSESIDTEVQDVPYLSTSWGRSFLNQVLSLELAPSSLLTDQERTNREHLVILVGVKCPC